MAISEFSKQYHEKMFPGYDSKFLETDSEFHMENMDQYDTVVLVYPNWWGTLPMPLYTFLEEYDFSITACFAGRIDGGVWGIEMDTGISEQPSRGLWQLFSLLPF